jgi:rubrerythrin
MAQTTLKAIEVALENEIQERNFYLKHGRMTKNPVGKEMFQRIAEDENEHYERLQKIHRELSSNGTWPETVSASIQGTNVMGILHTMKKTFSAIPPSDRDDIEAVRIAIDFEIKGYTFYSSLAYNAATDGEKNFFRMLASMEREHSQSLKETLQYFEDPAIWFAEREKPAIEG